MKRNLLSLAVAIVAIAGAGTQACAQTAPAEVQAVDLGLPSGLKWASCNIGATAPEDYGDYFAWGETAPKEDYSTMNYKYINGANNKLTKYCYLYSDGDNGFTDDKTVLVPEDDAATANWGGVWRMPTDAEWTELREQCTWTWTTQNGVNGHLVTSKTNSNAIFLPAAGWRSGTDHYLAGSDGYYWSSSLYDVNDPYSAWRINFSFSGVNRDNGSRNYGLSVRPVQEKQTGTGIDNTAADVTTDAHKIIRNGQIFIEKGGKTYTLTGVETE